MAGIDTVTTLEALALVTGFVSAKATDLPFPPEDIDLMVGCPLADEDHQDDWRVYAHTLHLPMVICIAQAFERLSDAHKCGILLHEFGHLYAGDGEADADLWVELATGIDLDYVETIQHVDPCLLRVQAALR